MRRADRVAAVHEEGFLWRRELPALLLRHAAQPREIVRDEVELRVAAARGEAREREQIHSGLAQRGERLGGLARAIRPGDRVAVVDPAYRHNVPPCLADGGLSRPTLRVKYMRQPRRWRTSCAAP